MKAVVLKARFGKMKLKTRVIQKKATKDLVGSWRRKAYFKTQYRKYFSNNI